jgi:hypothetical protein
VRWKAVVVVVVAALVVNVVVGLPVEPDERWEG